jgi:hypothetical protein
LLKEPPAKDAPWYAHDKADTKKPAHSATIASRQVKRYTRWDARRQSAPKNVFLAIVKTSRG